MGFESLKHIEDDMTLKKNRWTALIGAAGMAMWLAGCAGTEKAAFKPTRPYVEGEVIVQYKDGPESMEAREANVKMGATVLKSLPKLNISLVQLPPAADTVKAIEQYRKLPGVVTAEPNYVVSDMNVPAALPPAKAPAAKAKPAPSKKAKTPAKVKPKAKKAPASPKK